MEQYIKKSAVLAEIKELEKALINACKPNPLGNLEECLTDAELQAFDLVKKTIDTLEVKEVDLEKEWKEFLKDGDVGFKEIAKHFFELGLKAQKGE